jgi:lysophospholipid acyltransferase
LATYVVMALVPRKCGTLSWLINFPYLLCLHAANASGLSWNSGELDFTGGQMVLTLKLIALAMCVQDAQRQADAAAQQAQAEGDRGSPSKRGGHNTNTPPATNPAVLTRYQAAHAVPCAPPFLDYLGYIFCFGNLLSGPFIEYSDYSQFAARQGVWSPHATPRPAPLGAAFAQCARALFRALVCGALHSVWSPTWNGALFLSDWWRDQASIPIRLLAFLACGTTVRMKYYFAWSLGEASCALAGLDFVGWSDAEGAAGAAGARTEGGAPVESAAATSAPSNGGSAAADEQQQQVVTPSSQPKPVFGRCRNCDVLKVEFGDSSRAMPASWNTQTGVFLRRYVYERVTPPGRKPTFRTLLITQLVAGVWHGLYPGYFLFFATSALYFAHSTTLYNWERAGVVPRWLQQGVVGRGPYWACKVLATKVCLDYAASAFALLTWRECLMTYASVRYLPHWYMAAWLLLGRAFPVRGGGDKRKQAGGGGDGVGAVAAGAAAGKSKAA